MPTVTDWSAQIVLKVKGRSQFIDCQTQLNGTLPNLEIFERLSHAVHHLSGGVSALSDRYSAAERQREVQGLPAARSTDRLATAIPYSLLPIP